MANNAELIIAAGATLAEGPVWDVQAQLLYWVDIVEHRVHAFDPHTGEQRSFAVGQYVGAAVPRQSGNLLLAVQHGFATLDLVSGQIEMIAEVEPELQDNRFNDGKCDPAGRFWAGTMSLVGTAGAGSLYCLDTNLQVQRRLPNVTISNGLAWSRDQTTLYYIDTPTAAVVAFDYDRASGMIANPHTVIHIPPGSGWPDGMTIDAEGMLWVAHWGAGCVTRWDPARGIPLQTIAVPAAHVSSCCFGGPNLDQLYITTARFGLSQQELAAQPAAGSIFRVQPGVYGLPADVFAG